MQYYSKSRKSPAVFRYFRGPLEETVDAYLASLNGPPYEVSTGRVCSPSLIAFPSRHAAQGCPFRVALQGSRTDQSDPGKKGQTRAQRAAI